MELRRLPSTVMAPPVTLIDLDPKTWSICL